MVAAGTLADLEKGTGFGLLYELFLCYADGCSMLAYTSSADETDSWYSWDT